MLDFTPAWFPDMLAKTDDLLDNEELQGDVLVEHKFCTQCGNLMKRYEYKNKMFDGGTGKRLSPRIRWNCSLLGMSHDNFVVITRTF